MKVNFFILALVCPFFQHAVFAQIKDEVILNTMIPNILKEHHIPGAGIAIVSQDSILWMNALGQADLVDSVPVTSETLLGIGSIAKTFLALAALIAEEQGRVSIDDPIEHIVSIPQLTNSWSATHPVRLIHLLEHTSGISEAPFELAVHTNSRTPLPEVLKASSASLTTKWRPGQYYTYCNLGAIVAAYVIEEAVGITYEKYVQDHVLRPLKMRRATYHPDSLSNAYLSKGYRGSDYRKVPFPDLPQWPAGSLIASIEDMAKLVQLLLNDGRYEEHQIISAASVQRMETPETAMRAQQGIRFGYGKGLMSFFEQGHIFYGHGGRYGGFSSDFGYSPALGVGYIMLLNNADGNRAKKAIRQVLFDQLIPEEGVVEITSDTPVTSQPAASIAGCYQPITAEIEIAQCALRLLDLKMVEHEAGQWYHKNILGEKQRLVPVTSQQFKRAGETMATSIFIKNRDDTWQWLDNTAYQQIPIWWGYTQFFVAASCLLIIVLTLVIGIFMLPYRLVKKRKGWTLELIPLIAIGLLIAMVFSFIAMSNTLEKIPFLLWEALYQGFGWGFLVVSLASVFLSIKAIVTKKLMNPFTKYHVLVSSLACFLAASYLVYWGVV